MRAKFDFAADITIRGRNVSDRQRCDLTDAQTRVNREREAKTISLGVTSGFKDSKYPTNFRVREH